MSVFRVSRRLWALAMLAFGLVSMVVAAPGRADEAQVKTSSDPARTAALIVQLGSEEFTEREAATDELTRIGLAAFSALEAATVHPDREVRYRAVRILAQIRELDLQRRLEAFLAGKDETGEYPLPGWSRFAKAYGDDSQSRQLFVELQRADPELMRSIEEGPRAAAELATQRTQQHQQAMQLGNQQMTLGQVASLVFIAAEEDVALPASTQSMVLSYCFQQAMRDAMNNPAKKDVPRKMLGAAIRRSEDMAATNAMNLAMEYSLEEGLAPAVKILKNEAGRVPYLSLYALMTVARLGNASHLPLVEKLLDDKSVVTRMQEPNKPVQELQVRDAALATAIVLTKQELKSYFTGRAELKTIDPRQVYFNPRMIGFPVNNENDERAPVFKKWTEYKAQLPKEKLKADEPKAAPADAK